MGRSLSDSMGSSKWERQNSVWRNWRIIAIPSCTPHPHPFLHFIPATRSISISTINIPPLIYLLPLPLTKAESEEVALIAVSVGASAANILAGVGYGKSSCGRQEEAAGSGDRRDRNKGLSILQDPLGIRELYVVKTKGLEWWKC